MDCDYMDITDEFRISCKTFFVSLLVAVLVFSLFIGSSMNGVSGASLENAIHVKNENELKNAIDNAALKETIIALDNDITLTESALTVPYNKDITLTSNRSSGFYKLIGVANQATVVVDGGALRLDGIIVSGGGYSGVYVLNNGMLVMYAGEISDNTAYISGFNPWGYTGSGGGVRIDSGVFELYGGEISNNRAQGYGGGVSIGLGGAVFSMFGGTISGNTAETGGGGGVFKNGGNFSMFGGTISGNTAETGGGVYSIGDFSRFGGVISGNTATECNDVYPSGSGGSGSNGNGGGSGSNGNGGGSGSNGNGGLSGRGGFSLRDVVFVGVGVAIVIVGVVVAVLLFTFKKEVKHTKEKAL
jgi:hypothetical protein